MSKDAYSTGLTWENVFNGDLKAWNGFEDALNAAESTGYEFAAWRGSVFQLSKFFDGVRRWIPAFIRTEALDEGAAAVAQLRETLRKRDVKIEEMARGHERLKRERDEARGTVAPLSSPPREKAP